MKITAFRIRNYRSIVDSKNCFLSPDYITALIGQNESGKTSVLEALKSFYDGTITDDILRSDLTFPEITCTFQLDGGKTLADYVDLARMPAELHAFARSSTEVSLSRKWSNAKNNQLEIDEEAIRDFYHLQESNRTICDARIINSVTELMNQSDEAKIQTDTAENSLASARANINSLFLKSEDLKKSISKAKTPDVEIAAKQQLENTLQLVKQAEEELKTQLSLLEERKTKQKLLSTSVQACKDFNDLNTKIKTLQDEIKVNSSRLQEIEYQYKSCKSEREARNIGKVLEQLREKQGILRGELSKNLNMLSYTRKKAEKLLDGKELTIAEQEASSESENEKNQASLEDFGLSVFKHIPVFEFFEDFSSLLPNKIDLDDLLNENVHAEGYKAARNFLAVAGLNADFFREENHRILKQKIENLNTEITIDFQDYWRQSVGKDDKIRINFELEHYDNSLPEKSGKPYLEFWIKDKKERLYPKQRSRGVRWFLSFYLELKATAKENTIDRVMLIDEPGLSLHARAQEDVLKVFEDLREYLQIIYCTHSPNLIDLNKLYRIIAVQRARETDEKSETIVLDARCLSEASADTLSPIYALMGTRLNDKQFIFPKNNFIVEDSVTFHYLEAMSKLYKQANNIHYIPASGTDHIPVLANIFFGWKVDFGVIVSDTQANDNLVRFLKETTFCNNENGYAKKLIKLQGIHAIEDLFSTIDFKRFILKQRVGITVKNSEFIEMNKLSRMILVSDFLSKLSSEEVSFKDFDEETKNNFESLFSIICQASDKE